MKQLCYCLTLLLWSCSGPQKYVRAFEQSNTIGEFEAGLKKQHAKIDKVLSTFTITLCWLMARHTTATSAML